MTALPWLDADRQPAASGTASAPPVPGPGDRQPDHQPDHQPGPVTTARASRWRPPAPPAGDHQTPGESPASPRGFGWSRRQRDHQPVAGDTASPAASVQQGSDVADDRQNFELVVRADADGVVRADTVPTGELRRHWADTPRAATEHLGSLAELLRYAKHAQYNLAHYEAARAAHEVFFWMFTAPILITAWPFLWAYVIRFVRAVTFWVLTIVVAMPLNDLADWLVPDGLDVRTWSASAVQVAVGFVVVFVVATGLVVRRRRR